MVHWGICGTGKFCISSVIQCTYDNILIIIFLTATLVRLDFVLILVEGTDEFIITVDDVLSMGMKGRSGSLALSSNYEFKVSTAMQRQKEEINIPPAVACWS